MVDPLARFSPPTREWFASVFAAPTAVQAEAWRAIAAGEHALVAAPTGSGKTLAAFLWAIDSLGSGTVAGNGTRVVYVSPLKALGVDVERNLRAPLTGIRLAAERLGTPLADVTMASGDFTNANGDTNGRKTTVAAKSSVLIDTSGTATHVALLDVTNSKLLYVTTCTSQALTANGSNTVNFPAWDIEVADPT